MSKTKRYVPSIDFLLSLGFSHVSQYKCKRMAIDIKNDNRKLYYLISYNVFRHSANRFYPDMDEDIPTIIRLLTRK